MLPTITASRGANPLGFWESTRGRCLNLGELCRGQGFHESRLDWQRAGVTAGQVGKMVGNGMAVNIVELVVSRLVFAAGLIPQLPVQSDSWLQCAPAALPL